MKNEQQRYQRAKMRVEKEKGFYNHLTVYIIINIALLFINSQVIDNGIDSLLDWKLYITPILWGIGLLIHGITVFNTNKIFSKDWEERKIKELMDKEDF
ncbi:2TM domain-containing protein [Aquimarina sp. D1M17]|uniref:2TM domain-containing protein n=1 Tax=Aquimarina acroporae TaxID=2937283 RepID=UPI0020C17116|nr:2TM domain-containing protein [Aquimarina acroporae]MCK8522886.1 2TM domain-containing protein [Aquimarina acroporae]